MLRKLILSESLPSDSSKYQLASSSKLKIPTQKMLNDAALIRKFANQPSSLKGEKVSLRKLARVYTKSLMEKNSSNKSIKGTANPPRSIESFTLPAFKSESESTFGHSLSRMSNFDTEVLKIQRQKDANESRFRSTLRVTLGSVNSLHENLPNSTSLRSTKMPGELFRSHMIFSKRILLMRNIGQRSGFKNALSLVAGGPLEKITFHDSSCEPYMELHYIYYDDAMRFFNYATNTGLLNFNGHKFDLEWAPLHIPESRSLLSIPSYLLNEIQSHGARRCLLFSKVVPEKPIRHSRTMHYPSPKTHYSLDLTIEKIKEDFLRFGDLIEVGSVISRKLCFSLQFYDIRSAINAKKECEAEGFPMNLKYGEWTIWYGKDPADKPCLTV